MHALVAILSLILNALVTVYVVMIGQRTITLRIYKGFLAALTAWLAGVACVRLAHPGAVPFALGLRILHYPGQVAAFLLLAWFASVWPVRRELPGWLRKGALVLAIPCALYPYLVAPDLGAVAVGPYGFAMPAALDRACYGATFGAIRSLFLLGLLLFAVAQFIRAGWTCESAAARRSLQYVALSAAGPLLIGGLTELLPSLLFPATPVYPLFSAGAFLAAIVFAAAMTRHEVLELRLVVKNSLVYSTLTALVSAGYLLAAHLGNIFFSLVIPASTLVASYLFLFFTLLIVAPLRNRIQAFLDRTLFRDHVSGRALLDEFFALVATLDDRNRLVPQVLGTVRRHLRLDAAALILQTDDTPRDGEAPLYVAGGDAKYKTAAGGPLPANSALLAWFANRPGVNEPLLVNPAVIAGGDDLRTAIREAADLPFMRVSAVAPLRADNQLIGLLLLGDREGRGAFRTEDLAAVRTLADEFAHALLRLRTFSDRSSRDSAGRSQAADQRLLAALRDDLKAVRKLREAVGKNASRATLDSQLEADEKRLDAAIKRVAPAEGASRERR